MATEGPDPKTLTSWHDAFAYPIPAVRRMETQLRADVATGREKVRGLVGASYRELLDTAERIVEMDGVMQEVEGRLAELGRGCGVRAVEGRVRGLRAWERERGRRDRKRYAQASQLVVLQSCTLLITRLLRKRGSTLLAAKVLVLSRLLHKSLAQGADLPPYLDDLKTQLASLRRKLLVSIDRCFASSDVPPAGLVEAMCAFSLATSSLPKDVLRHFLHVRREALMGRLERNDGDGNVLEALRIYVQTLQDTQTLFPKRLAESLAKLKAQPLLRDPDVRDLMELNLDLHERWVADEVRNFTPWVRHEDLQKAEAEKVLKEWARKAFEAFLQGLRDRLQDIEDLTELVRLRKQLLEMWLSTDGQSPAFVTSEVLNGLRSAMNTQLNQVIRSSVYRLDLVSSEVKAIIEAWNPGVSDVHLSLWDASMTGMDVSNGATAFKQAILNRSRGRNNTLLRVLDKWNTWLRTVDEVGAVIERLKRTKWDVDLDADEDDEELELDSKETLLNEDDPLELEENFKDALLTAMSSMESKLQDCTATFKPESSPHQSLFLLRLVREFRQHLPKHYQNRRFGLSLVPAAHQTLADSILHTPLHAFERTIQKTSNTRNVPTRALWRGTPALPVQPSVAVFKLLHAIVDAMNHVGSDVWTVDATEVLKRELRGRLVPILEGSRNTRTASTQQQMNGSTDAVRDGQVEKPELEPAETVGSSFDEFDIQVLFDASFLQHATMSRLSKTKSGEDDDLSLSLAVLAEKIHSRVSDGVAKDGLDRVKKAAEGYWGKVGTRRVMYRSTSTPYQASARVSRLAEVEPHRHTARYRQLPLPSTKQKRIDNPPPAIEKNMATPRLTFLYPNFFRSIRACEPHVSRPFCDAPHHRSAPKAGFHSTSRGRQETQAQGYSPATEPPLPPPIGSGKVNPVKDTIKDLKATAPTTSEKKNAEPVAPKSDPKTTDQAAKKEINSATTGRSRSKDTKSTPSNSEAGPTRSIELAQDALSKDGAPNALETVLHVESESSSKTDEHKPPHLQAPPYVHHFDTYSLVKDLEKGSFTPDQSVTLMKAVRGLLAINLDVAKEGLVSKSDVENETYLFRAACSELRTEIQNARTSTSDTLRTERTHLQHEVDILNQKLTQDLLTLKDDLKGMFNDRKMAVRMEQRAMESAIQELNYKITVALNSDSKSEVEGLRWVLTRRAALAIAGMALLILSSLRYSSYKIHAREQAKKLAASSSSSSSSYSSTGSGNSGNFTVPSREAGTQTSDGLSLTSSPGVDPSLVSLG